MLTQLARKHTLETAARLDKLQSAQTHLLSRLMHLISRLHPLTSLAKTSIRPEEEALARRLTELKLAIDGKSTGAGRQHVVGKARVGELWALLGQVKAMSADRARGESGWAVVDEAELHKVLNVRPFTLIRVCSLADALDRSCRSNRPGWTTWSARSRR